MSRFVLTVMLLSTAMTLGCSDGDSSDSGETAAFNSKAKKADDKTAADEAVEQQVDAGPPRVEGPHRDSVAGNWILVICKQGRENSSFLFEFAEPEPEARGDAEQNSRYVMKFLDKIETAPVPSIKSYSTGDTSVNLVLVVNTTGIDFQGTLRDGIVWGNSVIQAQEDSECLAAYMFPTEETTLQGRDPVQRSDGLTELENGIPETNKVAFLKRFGERHKLSPLALEAYRTAIGTANFEGIAPKEVAEIADAHLKTARRWGDRMQQVARTDVATILALTRYQPEVAMKYLGEAESNLKSDSLKPFLSEQIEFGMLQARTIKAIGMIHGEDPEEQQNARRILSEVREKLPFDQVITFALAEYDEQQGRIDEAIENYAELASLPTLESLLQQQWAQEKSNKPLPSKTLARLWQQKHGNSDGLDKFTYEVYKRRITFFADKKVETRSVDSQNRVAICELFTGSACLPCVAADVAVGALQATYSKTDLIALRYHQHIPGANPLVNQHSEARFVFYGPRVAPSIYLNGELMLPSNVFVGQFLPQAQGIYNRLRKPLDLILKQKAEISIKASAQAQDGELTVSAEVSGAKDNDGPLKLQLVLAEEGIAYTAPNQIRRHDMVVRWVFGGSSGIGVSEADFLHSETIRLFEMRRQLIKYLTDFEQGRNVEFPVKPMELERLHLVAFVQDSDSKEILQAVTVPVVGELDYSSRTGSDD